MLSACAKKLVYRKARAKPKITYAELAKAAQVYALDSTPLKLPCRATLYRALKQNRLLNYRC